MKKRILGIAMIILILSVNFSWAQIKHGASPMTTYVNATTTYRNITFPYNTRDLIIQNNDSTAYVYVDVMNSDKTTPAGCFLLGPGNELNLYDYITSGISLVYDNVEFSTDTEASPISVLAVY